MSMADKLKAKTTQLVEKAQQVGEAGQAKIEQTLVKRKADAMLLELGGLAYTQQVGRPQANSEARITELVGLLQAHESANGPVTVTPASSSTGEPGTA